MIACYFSPLMRCQAFFAACFIFADMPRLICRLIFDADAAISYADAADSCRLPLVTQRQIILIISMMPRPRCRYAHAAADDAMPHDFAARHCFDALRADKLSMMPLPDVAMLLDRC